MPTLPCRLSKVCSLLQQRGPCVCVCVNGGWARTKAGVVLSSVSRGGSAFQPHSDRHALLYYTAFLAKGGGVCEGKSGSTSLDLEQAPGHFMARDAMNHVYNVSE